MLLGWSTIQEQTFLVTGSLEKGSPQMSSDLPVGGSKLLPGQNGYTYTNPPGLPGAVVAEPYQYTPVPSGQHNMTLVNAATCTFTGGSAAIAWTGAALAVGQRVVFATTGALPANLSVGTTYYVTSSSANTLQVSATPGGTAIIPGNIATAAAVASGGTSGFAVGDTMTLTGGTFTTAAVLKVTSVNGSGQVTGASIVTPGDYSVNPSNPVSMGSTSGAGVGTPTFTMTFGAAASGTQSFSANSLTVPANALYGKIISSTAAVRYTTDGTTPSATVGMPITNGLMYDINGPAMLAGFKAYGASTALLDIEYTQ